VPLELGATELNKIVKPQLAFLKQIARRVCFGRLLDAARNLQDPPRFGVDCSKVF
jgi:hypothetical protein